MQIYFNPLPRKEGDWKKQLVSPLQQHFNPLPRKEGDRILSLKKPNGTRISIHSLVKRETIRTGDFEIPEPNFNPLPRKEGDVKAYSNTHLPVISIHSLVKRETT